MNVYIQVASFFKFSLISRAAPHDNAIANEINRGIHLNNTGTLFYLGN